MQFRYRLIAAWLLATAASILVAFAAVASVRTAIADPPSALLLPDTTPPPIDLPPLSEIQQTTLPDPEVDDGAPVASTGANPESERADVETTTPSAAPSTTQASPVASTTAAEQAAPTTAAPTTSTTQAPTTEPPNDLVETHETEGGWVTIRFDDQGVFLESASPKPGWTVETEGSGPQQFTVVFKGEDEEIHVAVSYEHGDVEVDIED